MRYVFRADASQIIGSGHVMRSTAVAEELIARGEDVIFIGSVSGVTWLNAHISKIGFSSIYVESFNYISNPLLDVLILDSYTLQTEHTFIQPEKWHRIVLIADETTPNYKSDLVFYPGLLTEREFRSDTKVLAGPRYIPFRSSIQKYKKKLHAVGVLEILVVGGGTDPFNFAEEISQILSCTSADFHAYIFTSKGNIKNVDSRINYVPIGSLLDQFAKNTDLVLTTASTTSLEFIAREKAVGIGCATDNQRHYYNSLSSIGVAAPIGQFISGCWQLNADKILELISSEELRNSLIEKSNELIDLQGVKRIVEEIYKLN
jgi:spore coat polysaccharide biosynthesis predicted glycosyltransferase SpsG